MNKGYHGNMLKVPKLDGQSLIVLIICGMWNAFQSWFSGYWVNALRFSCLKLGRDTAPDTTWSSKKQISNLTSPMMVEVTCWPFVGIKFSRHTQLRLWTVGKYSTPNLCEFDRLCLLDLLKCSFVHYIHGFTSVNHHLPFISTGVSGTLVLLDSCPSVSIICNLSSLLLSSASFSSWGAVENVINVWSAIWCYLFWSMFLFVMTMYRCYPLATLDTFWQSGSAWHICFPLAVHGFLVWGYEVYTCDTDLILVEDSLMCLTLWGVNRSLYHWVFHPFCLGFTGF